jgi:large subunit ribosomal protein L29
MAKKAAAKEQSLNEMSVKELETLLAESQEKSFRLKFQHASNPLKNPMLIRTARREIAKVRTFLRQKEKVA